MADCSEMPEEGWGRRHPGRCYFYPGRDCPGWTAGKHCGRMGDPIPQGAGPSRIVDLDGEFGRPESVLDRMDQPDKDQGQAAFLGWIQRVLAEPGVDLSAIPERAFMAGYAYASQFRWD